METITIKKTCIFCGTENHVSLTTEEHGRILRGEHVQHVLPDLSADDREKMISGTCPKCWERTNLLPPPSLTSRKLTQPLTFLALILAIVMLGAACTTGLDTAELQSTPAETTQPADTTTQPAAAATTTTQPPNELGTRTNPFPIGAPGSFLLSDSLGAENESTWQIRIVGPGFDGTEAVADENMFNDPPTTDSSFYMVPIEATLLKSDNEPLITAFTFDLELFLPGTKTVSNRFCGVAPEEFDSWQDVFIGGTLTGNFCMEAPTADIGSGLLIAVDNIFWATR